MDSERLGILLILFGMSLFCIQDIFIKLIINDTSILQILVFRALLGFIFLTGYLYINKKKIIYTSNYPVIAIIRGTLFFIGFIFFYISLTKIPLAEANALFFTNPIIVTFLSVFLLKNPIGIHRILAIIICCIGTLLIIKPSIYNFNWYILLPIFTAFSYAISMVLSKITSDKDNSFQQSFHIYLGGIILGSLLSIVLTNQSVSSLSLLSILSTKWIFTDLNIIYKLIIIAVVGTAGIFCLVSAYRIGSPSANAPFEYILLIYALISGYILFNEIPDIYSLIGMTLIIMSGIYVFVRESFNKRLIATIKSR